MSDNMEDKYDLKIVDLSDSDLIQAGFLCDGASEAVKQMVKAIRANPERLGGKSLRITWFMLECKRFSEQQDAFELTSYPTWSDTSALVSQCSTSSDASTIVGPDGISDFERVHYWHGISLDPPELLYHSDLKSNPFLIPSPGTRWFTLPVKTAHEVFNTVLNSVWHIVAPLIIDLFKKCDIKYSSLMTICFTTEHDGKKTLGPIAIWIATHPGTTTTQNACDSSPDILHILEDNGVNGAVVEWYEGSVERLAG